MRSNDRSEFTAKIMASSFIYILAFLLSVLFLFKLYYYRRTTTSTTKNPPRSPPTLPIIGNLHQLEPLVHRSFFSLSQRYGTGPLMLLYMGSVPTLVASSSEAAHEIMQTQDIKFSDKPPLYIFKTIFYDLKEIVVAPYGEYWRQAKKTLILHYASSKMVQNYSVIRDEELAITIDEIEKLSSRNNVINLGELLFEHVNDVSCRATFGRKYNADVEIGRKFKKIAEEELPKIFSRFYFVDFIPWLGWIDRINGAYRKSKMVSKELDEILEMAVEERLAKLDLHEVGDVEPFIDQLLRIHKQDSIKGFSLDRDSVKALILDTILAGTDTTTSVLEWTMAELLTHPRTLKKLQEEVRTTVNGRNYITDNDLEKMKYLKAVIMEVTRLHPPIPVPIPRVTTQDVKVMGFDIPKGTIVYVNIWAIGRDPKVWDRPDEFIPERFVGSSVDFVRHEFKFIPFGGGRRSCPGRVFGMAIVENVLANLLCKFDWALPDGEVVNLEETIGVAYRLKAPLFALATPFSG